VKPGANGLCTQALPVTSLQTLRTVMTSASTLTSFGRRILAFVSRLSRKRNNGTVKPGARWPSRRMASMLFLTAALLVCTVPGFTSSFSTQRAQDSAVRISVVLVWPQFRDVSDVCGSGWTRACVADGHGWETIVATAAHVLDVDELENAQHPGQRAQVTVLITYRDGQEFAATRGSQMMVDRTRDYGEVRFHSSLPRPVLAVDDPDSLALGAPLTAVASPGNTAYGVYHGELLITGIGALVGLDQGWLSTVPVAPGASGGPVMDENGRVVATIIGQVDTPAGLHASVLAPLPSAIISTPSSGADAPKKGAR